MSGGDGDPNRPDSGSAAGLSSGVVNAIDRIEPPPPRPDFWARLDAAMDEGEVAVSPLPARAPLGMRAAAIGLVAAVLIAVVGTAVVLRRRGLSDTSVVVTDPAETSSTGTSDPPSSTTAADEEVLSVTGEQSAPTSSPGSSALSTTPSAAPAETTVPTETTETSGSGTSASVPEVIRLEAETMTTRSVGTDTAEGWNLWSAGHLEEVVDIPVAGRYRITVRAKGFSTAATMPVMEVRFGAAVIDAVPVALGGYRQYEFSVDARAGAQSLRLSFINDPNVPENDVDLTIDYVELRPLN